MTGPPMTIRSGTKSERPRLRLGGAEGRGLGRVAAAAETGAFCSSRRQIPAPIRRSFTRRC